MRGLPAQPQCDAYIVVSGYEVRLVCHLTASHGDEPGPGDQDLHYDRNENLYWIQGLPTVSRETED